MPDIGSHYWIKVCYGHTTVETRAKCLGCGLWLQDGTDKPISEKVYLIKVGAPAPENPIAFNPFPQRGDGPLAAS